MTKRCMKTYVVNLARDVQRMASIKRQLDGFGIEFERIEAVYGKALTFAEKQRDVARFRSLLANGGPLLDGEIGCSLSHLKIYREMIEKRIDIALVLEDDIVMTDSFPLALEYIQKQINSSRAQVYLPARQSVNEKLGNDPYKLVSTQWAICTDAYVITRPAAQLILHENYPVRTVADSWTRWHRQFGLELFRCLPPSALQDCDRFGTVIGQNTRETSHTQAICFLRMLKRRSLKFIDLLLWHIFKI